MSRDINTSLPMLMVIADLDYLGDDGKWLDTVAEVGDALTGSNAWIQLRMRSQPEERVRVLAAEASRRLQNRTVLALNGFTEVARALSLPGVHIREPQMSSQPTALAEFSLMSVSAHSVAAVEQAEAWSPSAIIFSPVFHSTWKYSTPHGLGGLRSAVESTQVPVLALGGISLEHVEDCIQCGAQGVAVLSGIMGAASPRKATEQYLNAVGK